MKLTIHRNLEVEKVAFVSHVPVLLTISCSQHMARAFFMFRRVDYPSRWCIGNSLGKSSDLLNWANLNFIATADLILLEILPSIDQRQAEPVPRTNFISAMEYGGYCQSGMATMTHNYYPSIFLSRGRQSSYMYVYVY